MQANAGTTMTLEAWNALWRDLDHADAAYCAADDGGDEAAAEAATALSYAIQDRIWASASPSLEIAIKKLELAILLDDAPADSPLHKVLQDLRRIA